VASEVDAYKKIENLAISGALKDTSYLGYANQPAAFLRTLINLGVLALKCGEECIVVEVFIHVLIVENVFCLFVHALATKKNNGACCSPNNSFNNFDETRERGNAFVFTAY
jgi:hypothetical protein